MSALETAKKIAGKMTAWSRPSNTDLTEPVRQRKANAFRFRDDGIIPNHPRWPLIIYRGVLRLPVGLDPATVFEDLFDSNSWGDSWRDGIYDYVHYHSRIHEVLGIARGTGKVQFGGRCGCTLALKAGDAAILPAGTGHQSLSASKDFLVVGPIRHQASTTSAPAARTRSALSKRFLRSEDRAKIPFLGAMVRCSKHGNPSGNIIAIDLGSRHPSIVV